MCAFQLTLFVAVRTHKNQDKPLAVDANVSASHRCYSRLKILERAQIFSACYTITLRVLHPPQGDKQNINTFLYSIMENNEEYVSTSLRLLLGPTDRREETMKLMSTADNRQCANKGWLLITKLEKVYFHVYRLEEDGSLLQEGGVRLSLRAIRACSYKTEAEDRHQGFAPYSSRGLYLFFSILKNKSV